MMNETIEQLAEGAFEAGATDLFLCQDQVPRIRLDDTIQIPGASAVSYDTMRSFWEQCHADPDHVHELDTSHSISGGRRLRVNLYKSLGLLSAVLRPIKEDIPTMEQLGVPEALVTDWVSRKSGLVLVTGPTGSGKSTTLASALQWVNEHHARHVITIEDPIEYIFANNLSYFSQRELHADTDSFSTALRSSLRQSPDIILLGEIRDQETAKIALQAAETGHLVVATLHSSGVTDSLERLANLFSPDDRESSLKLLAQHLIGVLSQQLLPRPDGGLLLAVEHLQNEAATRAWIHENNHTAIADHINRGDSSLNCSFVRFLVAAAQQGYITEQVARQAAPNAQDFDRLFRGIS
ncbi:MAG: PilT/PilU family type 4a pilus ATPase [Verrucomicrobiae bacterium]|nr:PilT/PilU family type 4a pilus ATPase [Verrucomicrobiae bacterium]NNJ87346.1 PilT/PilU family type 4a pilus ATPase [Akkermansiaceae bacterium]